MLKMETYTSLIRFVEEHSIMEEQKGIDWVTRRIPDSDVNGEFAKNRQI